MVANAKSPAEIDEIEQSVKQGIFPTLPTTGADSRKRAVEDASENGTATKRGKLKDDGE